uniref:Uncharacterized protein n=1 Tax=Arundo donax TaxID=35708 RepID=A0A0A9A2H0_ARUDO
MNYLVMYCLMIWMVEPSSNRKINYLALDQNQ